MKVTDSELGPQEFRAAIRELVAVYAAAMNAPERLLGGREAIMDRHAASPGFRCLTATADGVIAGFTYGFHGETGQWWHDMVASALAVHPGAGHQDRGTHADQTRRYRRRLARQLLRDRGTACAPALPGHGNRPFPAALADLWTARTHRGAVYRRRTDPRQATVPRGWVHRPADRVQVLWERAALRGDGRPAAPVRGPTPCIRRRETRQAAALLCPGATRLRGRGGQPGRAARRSPWSRGSR